MKGEILGERLRNMLAHALGVVKTLRIKNPKYGDSWKSRGGKSAYTNIERKWSRVQHLAEQHGDDIFAAIDATRGEPDGMLESLKDLLGYGVLILDEKEPAMEGGTEVVAAWHQMEPKAPRCVYSLIECPDPDCETHGPHVVVRR